MNSGKPISIMPHMMLCSILLTLGVAVDVRAESVGCDWQDVLTGYDANGDGRLDSKEREVLRKSRPMGFTSDPGRGTWDRAAHNRRRNSGKSAPPPAHPLARFDKNENNILEAAELAAARAAVQSKRTKRKTNSPKSE